MAVMGSVLRLVIIGILIASLFASSSYARCINTPRELCAVAVGLPCEYDTYAADINDCSRGMNCIGGRWESRWCDVYENYHFHYEKCTCEKYRDSKCFDKKICSALPSTTTSLTTKLPTVLSTTTTPQTTKLPIVCINTPAEVCAVAPGLPCNSNEHAADVRDCSRFMNCIRGRWQAQWCDVTQYDFFNYETCKCGEYEDRKCFDREKCIAFSPATRPQTTKLPTASAYPILPNLHLVSDCIIEPSRILSTSSYCTPRSQKAHVTNCSVYKKCSSNARWYQVKCPYDTMYDYKTCMCTRSDLAGCFKEHAHKHDNKNQIKYAPEGDMPTHV